MALPHGISPLPISQWANRHQNFTQQLRSGTSFKLYNPDLERRWDRYLATAKNFQWLIEDALERGHTLRALGRGWSFSKVGVCDGGLVDTMALTLSFNLTNAHLSRDFLSQGNASDLILAQCGLGIDLLNQKLEQESFPKRCLRASGAANGQSIVGAASTNTHGGAFRYGAVHDQIVGIHLITGPDEQVWLERESQPVVTSEFVELLGAQHIRSDALFNAAVVGFGSFGFVAGVLLSVRPIVLLEEHRAVGIPYTLRVRQALNTLQLDDIRDLIPGPYGQVGYTPYHFEVGFNPHQLEEDSKEKGLFLRILYETDYRMDYPRIVPTSEFEYGENTLEILQVALDRLGRRAERFIPGLVKKLYPLAYSPGPARQGTMGEHFNSTRVRGKAASLAIGLDVAQTSQVIALVVEMNKAKPFAGVTALRFVKGTKATLGFTRFPNTCVLELDGIDTESTAAFYRNFLDRLEEQNIRYTLHWGKVNSMVDEARLRYMYPQSAIDEWVKARTQLLGSAVREVFTNDFMRQCGLDRAAVIT